MNDDKKRVTWGEIKGINQDLKRALRKEKAKLAKMEKLRVQNCALGDELESVRMKLASFTLWALGGGGL